MTRPKNECVKEAKQFISRVNADTANYKRSMTTYEYIEGMKLIDVIDEKIETIKRRHKELLDLVYELHLDLLRHAKDQTYPSPGILAEVLDHDLVEKKFIVDDKENLDDETGSTCS